MENPNFTFVIGDPAEDATGRSAQGRVLLEENRWHFEADLVRRWSPKRYQFNRIALTIERPFDAPRLPEHAELVGIVRQVRDEHRDQSNLCGKPNRFAHCSGRAAGWVQSAAGA